MGNCIRKESSTQWGGENWGSETPFSDHKTETQPMNIEENSLRKVSSALGKEVKIKITKKQLEEMLIKADIQGLSAHQILAQLMNDRGRFESHHRSWTPAQQSIPE
ncbi:unnamed protein product [Fraxinus pennsylvanica]|uniref:Uncharacterized protein n=1 Tax=Fraxinus pennsylvanica TaxID=56036 RepID=A0AAD2DK62_9LAMI|nr:unnamed protein product [Fraxinus pennsylvanica]